MGEDPHTLFFFGGILVPQPGIEPGPSAVKVPCPNHRPAREFPCFLIFQFNVLPEMQLIFWNTAKFHSEACCLQWALQNRFDFYMHTFTTSNSSISYCAPFWAHLRAFTCKDSGLESWSLSSKRTCTLHLNGSIHNILKYPWYRIPPYFLSTWCSYEESAPQPLSLAFSA